MKRIYLTFFVALFSTLAFAQAIHIFHDGETEPKVFANGAIQRISFQPKFLGSTEYQHVYETLDGEFRFDKVDSVKFNLPHLVTYKKEFVLPYDVSGFYVGYSSSYPAVSIPNLNEWSSNKPNWYEVNRNKNAEYPQTAEYELCAGDIKVPFKVTITNKPALDYFYVKYKNKELSKKDSIRFSTGFYDSRVLSPEVESLVFPRVADNLGITGFRYATISNRIGFFISSMACKWRL